MALEAAVREAIKNIVKTMMLESGISCEVVSVDKEAFTCDVKSLDREIDYFDVRLLASSGNSITEGIITFPKVGSEVNIVLLDETDNVAFVSKYSEIESYEVRIGAMSFYIDKDVIKLGGNADNMVRWTALNTSLQQEVVLINQNMAAIAGNLTPLNSYVNTLVPGTVPTPYSPTTVSVDIAASKVENIKTS